MQVRMQIQFLAPGVGKMASSFNPYLAINFDPGGTEKLFLLQLFWILYDSPRRENV